MLAGGLILAQSSSNCSDDRAFLGIYTNQISAKKAALLQLPEQQGSMIEEVLIGGAADRAGLQPFDYIYGIDDFRTDADTDLSDLLSRYKAGQQATVHLIRQGKQMAVNLIFGRQSDSSRRDRDEDEKPFLGISDRGRAEGGRSGIRISVVSQSTAQDMGLQSGDQLLAINEHPIIDWSDVTTAINMMEVGDPITVAFERDGRSMKATAVIKSHEATYDDQEEQEDREDQGDQEAESAFLGVYSNSLSRTKAHKLGFDNPYGSYVTKVIPNTAADRARIQPFDYIYGVDEYRTGEGQSLTVILHKYEVGDRANLHLVRKNREIQVPVTFSSREDRREVETDRCEEPFLGVQSSHTYVEGTGVSVVIIENSTAKALGMQDNDLITHINGYPILDWDDIRTAINNMAVGTNVQVVWKRAGREMKASHTIANYCETITNQIIYKENSRRDLTVRAPALPDLSNLEVVIGDINATEAGEMKRRYNVELSQDNTVSLQSIRIDTHAERGVFELSFELPRSGETTVRIFNNLGRNIYVYELGSFSGRFSDEVDLSQNGVGTYYLHVQQGGRSASKRLLVRKG